MQSHQESETSKYEEITIEKKKQINYILIGVSNNTK
jgi:hypothetical protein